eukprot:ANDGO_01696.mRNA.1 Rhomboid-like protein 15
MSSRVSMGTHFSTWWSSIALCTRVVFTLCVGLYGGFFLLGVDPWSFCFNPVIILFESTVDNQIVLPLILRPVLSVLSHGSLVHIAMNMMTLLQFGASVERFVGSLPYAYLQLLFGIISHASITVLGFLAMWIAGSTAILSGCAVGYSGILFGLMVVDNEMNRSDRRSVMGMFTVPARLYPPVLLVLMQFLIPGASLWGHAAGMLAGYLYISGYLRYLVPRSEIFSAIESKTGLLKIGSCISTSSAIDTYAGRLPSSITGGPPNGSSPGTVAAAAVGTHVLPMFVGGRSRGSAGADADSVAMQSNPRYAGPASSAPSPRSVGPSPVPIRDAVDDATGGFAVGAGSSRSDGYARLANDDNDSDNENDNGRGPTVSGAQPQTLVNGLTPSQLAAQAALARIEAQKQKPANPASPSSLSH